MARWVHPPKSMMHVAYSPHISTKFINLPYFRKIYKFPVFLLNLDRFVKFTLFASPPILTMMHLRIML